MGFQITENEPFEGIITSLKPPFFYSIREAVENTEKHIEKRKNCPKCKGRGFLFHTEENRVKIYEKVRAMKKKIEGKKAIDGDLGKMLGGFVEKVVTKSVSSTYECRCRFNLDFYVKRLKLLKRAVAWGADIDYIYNINDCFFENRAQFLSHMILSTLIERVLLYNQAPKTFAFVYYLESDELDHEEYFKILNSKYDFIYIENVENCEGNHKQYRTFIKKISRRFRLIELGLKDGQPVSSY